ncbi:MAG: NADH-quinone oxidoreductase subunit NuoK [Candidatus Poseidoniales archaeon]|jgi:NADH-quinone oxidoreductase subunit K|nr:NADH-quinone oxidoreductase subunit NuoK [Euryarchaeota archaeon]MEC8670014.1 NADH-quinone oxidoreductase subunit NuoK [Candidatus Thermoplasmatota archaeon]RJU85867.1 MAG: NADH-quinone oxidoreductase subunit NuoK [Candidatus Poseidoniales archaeon]MBT7243921.1 NADH-quinone oxidoreductase subunit NuoK [Euryarchaeota archaeon]MEC8788813.1 NADH-quinone oxidoreductase subunit NuoK [Candidatus Thermoplasmatota archaeon]|tara:strand:+ start:1501 stop:1803 length:303 start_codon:yes stop_codon:yes gene_type:complete
MIDPAWVSGLAAILFIIGLWGAFSRKNAIVVLMCIELMLNAVNLQFVAAASHWGDVTGWVYAVFAIAIAAAEVAIGLAIFLSMYGQHETISLDEVNLLKN